MIDMTGHGVCIDCKSGMFQESERPNCPNCRLRIRDRDAHPLFLELVDSKESKDAFISNLVENIDKMDQETPLSSVKRAGNKLTMVLQDPQLMAESLAMVKKNPAFFVLFFVLIFPFSSSFLLCSPLNVCTGQGYRRFQRTYRSSLYQSTSSDTRKYRLERGLPGEPWGKRKFTGSTDKGWKELQPTWNWVEWD